MQEKAFREYCKKRKFDSKGADAAVEYVLEFEACLNGRGRTLESAGVDDLEKYISDLISRKKNSVERLLALARYSYVVKKNELYIHLASIIGAEGILSTLSDRIATIAGEGVRKRVFEGIEEPPFGTAPDAYPAITKKVVARLESELPVATCRGVLAGNMHKIPHETFNDRKELFLKTESIDEFLKELHGLAVAELEEHMKEGKLWYEQEITPQVVEFVRGNQELLSGIRKGMKIYMTKIPYAPKDYLGEKDPMMKRYYACHCPLARSSILESKHSVSPTWCYCSGGYEKLMYDILFDEPVEVEVLESALGGDRRCRFSITIPKGKFK